MAKFAVAYEFGFDGLNLSVEEADDWRGALEKALQKVGAQSALETVLSLPHDLQAAKSLAADQDWDFDVVEVKE